ncbi:hypothetical protein [Thermoactinospora rubra]|uniref:hypothetical protein n=1 Tax=Thermoactinospora rubra TaxID=1088767 RepID=UPI000A10E5E3|nr:hypothetical protein [Thermoactinospora rubra]
MSTRWMLIVAAGTVLAWFAGPPAMASLGYEMPGWRAAALAGAGLAVFALTRALPRPRPPALRPRSSQTALHAPRVSTGVDLWRLRLSAGREDPERFRRTVLARLAEIADERLRRRHGVGLAEAAAVLGEEAHAMLTSPVARVPSEAELARLITRIEET